MSSMCKPPLMKPVGTTMSGAATNSAIATPQTAHPLTRGRRMGRASVTDVASRP
jgi:hypothetical protein